MLRKQGRQKVQINKIYQGNNLDILKTFEDNSINCCITSPPYYGLRDYGTGKWIGGDPNCDHKQAKLATRFDYDVSDKQYSNAGSNVPMYQKVCPICGAIREDKQVGLEESPEMYIQRLVDIFTEVKRVLKDDGTLWVNIGDTYNASSYRKDENSSGHGKQGTNKGSYENVVERPTVQNCKPKDLIGIPWMLAFALRDSGWYLRQDIIWAKPNPMPEPIKDRCGKSHEYIFLFSKSPKYYFDYEAIQEPCWASNTQGMKTMTGKRNKRDVWTVVPAHYKEAHFATFPEELVYPMIIAGCPKDGVVLDPFMGSGTVGSVAIKNHRNYVGCELNPDYIDMALRRINHTTIKLF